VRHGPSKDSAGSAAWRICPEAPCDAGLPRLRLNWGKPVRPARRVLPLDVRHRALLVDKGRDAWQTLTAELRGVNSGSPVVRTARTSATLCHGHDSGTQLYISIVAWLEFGYSTAIGQTLCIGQEAFFLIRRSNNSAGTSRAPRPPDAQYGARHGRRQMSEERTERGESIEGGARPPAAPHRPEGPMRPAQLP
jgi:hypothetical protein